MIGRNRQGRRPRHLQEPSQVLGFAPEFLTNRGDLGRLSFRLKGGDQVAQPRPQLGGVERFVIGKAREIAEQPTEPAQSSRPRFLHALPGLTPLGRDLVIEKREACIRQPQQREAQKAGDLDRAMRILDPRQRRRFPRHHPSREMLQTGERQIRQDQPVGAQFLEEADLLDLLGKAFGGLARRHGTKPFAPADPAVLDRRQKARHPALPVGRQGRHDELEQGLLVMPPRGDHADAGCRARGAAGNDARPATNGRAP